MSWLFEKINKIDGAVAYLAKRTENLTLKDRETGQRKS